MLKQLLNSTAKMVIIVALFAILLVLNFYMWSKDRDQEREIVDLQKELQHQHEENEKISRVNEDLKNKIKSLKLGKNEMIEEEARGGFGMVGKGETFYHFESKADKQKEKPQQ